MLALTYGNGDGHIAAYEPLADGIRVEFRNKTGSAVYRYTNDSAGAENVEQMLKLASSGKGLGSFINRAVRELYEQRES